MNHKSHVAWNKGLTKETSESVKHGSELLKRKKSNLELELDDDGKLRRRWINKKYNAKKEGLECKLTYDEYCTLVKEAGLVSSQLGFTGEKYVLGRYNDEGDYTLENCRFITQKENNDEKQERIFKAKGKEYIPLTYEKHRKRQYRRRNGENNICICGNWKASEAVMCKECYLKHKGEYIQGTDKIKPTSDELQELLKTNSKEKIGRMYGVSGKAVAKWADKYKLK